MLAPAELIILGFLVFFSYTAQAMTGFGSIVVALTLGSLVFPIRTILPVLVALNIPLCLWILYKKYNEIDYAFLLKRILPLMSLGVLAGIFLDDKLEGPILRRIFGALILAFAIKELVMLALTQSSTPKSGNSRLNYHANSLWIFIAGLVHGIYASGGPPLVHALSRSSLNRQAFRATLTAVWFILNGALLGLYIYDTRFGIEQSRQFLYLLPAIPLALKAGEWLHKRVSDKAFRITLQGLLALSAGALLI